MIISYDNDSLIFDMHIMMKMISRYYHSIITQISIKYQNINSQTNNILSRYFDKPQYCTLVGILQSSRNSSGILLGSRARLDRLVDDIKSALISVRFDSR